MSAMQNLVIAANVLEKLCVKHGVRQREVEQCFENIDGPLLMDTREEHQTDPPTLWFISQTNSNRWLKVVYVQKGSTVFLKTCYAPNETEMRIYLSHRRNS